MKRVLLATALMAAASSTCLAAETVLHDGEFRVVRIDGNTAPFCLMSRVAQPKGFFLGTQLNPDGATISLMLTLADSRVSWTPGQITLRVDGRPWNAVASVSQQYPNQLTVNIGAGAGTTTFLQALVYGMRLTIESKPGIYPGFSYDVSLVGSAVAMSVLRDCAFSLVGRIPPAPAPRAPTVRPAGPPKEIII